MREVFWTLLIAALSLNSFGAVWESKSNWSIEEEDRYSQWVEKSVDLDIFTDQDSPYYGFPTDCADAAYTLRIIYSFENDLPFAFYSRRLKRMISNKISKWDLKPDKYFSKNINAAPKNQASLIRNAWQKYDIKTKKLWLFTNLVNKITSTWSLHNHTYPVKVDQTGIRPGTIGLIRRFHTYIIKDVDSYGNIYFSNSTVPPLVRDLSLTSSFFIMPRYRYEEGFLQFKWPSEARIHSSKIKRS